MRYGETATEVVLSVSGEALQSKTNRDAVLQQLERILAHQVFQQSKRCSALLSYVVTKVIEDQSGHLKERILGIEVFGRNPDYDTNADPVVRMAAGEVRKRIAQYYHEPGHRAEIRIDLPSGSYVPVFRRPAEIAKVSQGSYPGRNRTLYLLSSVVIAVLLFFLGIYVGRMDADSVLDKFWNPILESPDTVMLCLPALMNYREKDRHANGEGPGNVQVLPALIEPHRKINQKLYLADALTLTELAGFLQVKRKKYRIKDVETVTRMDFKEGPAVLIGVSNNSWTIRLTSKLRFIYTTNPEEKINQVVDQENPSERKWVTDAGATYTDITEDYAIISRFRDSTSGQQVVAAAGLSQLSTKAAGDFLTDPAVMDQLVGQAPDGWEQKNIQLVIATEVVDNVTGPPRIQAIHVW